VYDGTVTSAESNGRSTAGSRKPAADALTIDRVLDAAEQELRRFGSAKTTVVDVARKLGVSHAAVYRYVSTKAELRSAVVDRWLTRLFLPLEAIATSDRPAMSRLREWLDTLIAAKRKNLRDDPEMFELYSQLAATAPTVVNDQLNRLVAQIEVILSSGIASGAIDCENAADAARAVLSATSRFHHPGHAPEWSDPAIDARFEAVWTLIVTGLRRRVEP